MSWGALIGGVAGGYFGMKGQQSAAEEAARANLLQQEKALAFQREMNAKSIGYLEEGATDLARLGQRLTKQGAGQVRAEMMNRGINPASSMYLQAQRGMMADVNNYLLDQQYTRARDKAAVYQNQEFPMIMQEGPQGNWAADYAKLGMMMGEAFDSAGDD